MSGAHGGAPAAGHDQSRAAIVVGGDGIFRALPAKRALTNGADTPAKAEKFRISTVFAADGRFVHLRKPLEAKQPANPHDTQESREPAMPSRQAPSQNNFTDVGTADTVWKVQKDGCIEVRVPHNSTGLAACDLQPADSIVSKPKESWLDLRLKHAQAQPAQGWHHRIAHSQKMPEQEDLEDNAPSASLEVKIFKRSPTSFRESSASLTVRAASMQTLDRIILNSVDGLVAEMRPAL